MKRKRLLNAIVMTLTLLSLYTPHASWAATTPDTFETDALGLKGKSIGEFAKNEGIVKLIQLVINAFTAVVIALALIMIVISGFVYMAAEGDEGKITTAKGMLLAAAYGITFALLAQLLLNTISPQFAEEAVKPFFGK